MWIIPKTLSQYAPATPGLSLESSEQAWMLEQSVTWRSKFMSRQYWSKRWRKGDYVRHLCGLMLKPSLHQSFVEKYTASLPDIHANPSVQRASAKARMTQDTYGHISESTSGQLDLFGAFSRMSGDTPRWGYGESCPIWKKMVTERSGDCSARRKQARLTSASDASSWQNYPTPAARDYKGTNSEEHVLHKSKGFKGHMNQLPNFIKYGISNSQTPATPKAIQQSKDVSVRAWATPQASDHVEGARTAKESNQKCLGRDLNQMQNWPTPRAQESTESYETLSKRKAGAMNMTAMVKLHGPPAPEKSNTSGKNHGSWPTARSSDAEGGRIKTEKTEKGFRSKREKSDQYFGAKLRDAAEMEKPPSMKLNPNWVEQLMGLSTGWTDLGCWGTE